MFLWFSYGYDHQSQGSGPSGITSLGDFSPSVSMGHTSSESMGGSAAAHRLAGRQRCRRGAEVARVEADQTAEGGVPIRDVQKT